MVHVFLGDDGRMDVVLDGVVFRRQAESVPPDGIQDVVALHPALPGDDVQRRVGAGMPYVQALSGGIGELDQAVVLLFIGRKLRFKGVLIFPDPLPFGLDFRWIIGHNAHDTGLLGM